MSTNKPGEDEFSRKLSELVEKLKDNEKFRSEYAAMNLHDRDIIRQAKKEASLDKAIEDAKNFYANGASIELIAKSLKMTREQVQEIVSGVEVIK